MVKVSIIVPIYKVEKYIERCLRSVMAQTYEGPLECILVDDCTPDGSMEIVEQVLAGYSGNICFKVVRHERNSGLSVARNTGVENATGEYLYFLDSDDEIEPCCIKCLMDLAIAYRPDFVQGGIRVIDGDRITFLPIPIRVFIQSNKEIARLYANQKWYVTAWNKLISKVFWEKYRLSFYPGIYHEDELWSFELALFAEKMAVCSSVTYNYFKREGAITSYISEKHINDKLVVIENCNSLLVKFPNAELEKRLRAVCMGLLLTVSKNDFSFSLKKEIVKKMQSKIAVQLKYPWRANDLKDIAKSIALLLPPRLSLFYSSCLNAFLAKR